MLFKPRYEEPLVNVAFNFILGCYSLDDTGNKRAKAVLDATDKSKVRFGSKLVM